MLHVSSSTCSTRRCPRVTPATDHNTINEVVSAVLEMHRDYSKEAMINLLQSKFSDVPHEYGALFVNTVTSATQYIAGVEI